ncbi:acetylornithine transaminase [Alkalihalophilus pseudofirmus]|uniref:Acetylornithine aminotransferase n=1 Tax=Alkalihalophilus pseudofirmus TaxID=79885 RepID=A0AAJ2NNM2_ALKPS|nr:MULTISPECIES: acetylornithine transaminase [Alkalihalophilus]MDV2885681.1 acetylornithine transaminase [Alkalihalophilus pseudofirmus]MED1601002.1 acetylornithine transaminase [Alkalihalophilus marmarensis]
MSALFPTYARWQLEPVSGEGALLVDSSGVTYLDFVAGIAVCNLGHCHPKVNQAVKEQVESLWHVSNLFQIKQQEQAAKTLTDYSVLDKVFFCNSGAEANEAAIKLARKATGKHKILSFHQSFHGRTIGSMSATGQSKVHEGYGPLLSEFEYLPYNDENALSDAVDSEVAAIMVEVIQGEGGVTPMTQAFADKLKEVTELHGCLLIIDEVQTGIGRTGTLFAYEQYGLSPDIITAAKGLGNGFPVGAMLGKEHLTPYFQAGSHGSTFGGNPLAMAAVNAVLKEVVTENLLEDVTKKGKWVINELIDFSKKMDEIVEVRGKGLMIGIECKHEAAPLVAALREQKLLVLQAGPNVLRLLPPLVVTNEQLEQAVEAVKNVFKSSTLLTQ